MDTPANATTMPANVANWWTVQVLHFADVFIQRPTAETLEGLMAICRQYRDAVETKQTTAPTITRTWNGETKADY